MKKFNTLPTLFAFFIVIVGIWSPVEARILAQCDAVKELQRAGISRTMISSWVCLMQSESRMNTSLVTGPGSKSSYSFGVFQINSLKWCTRGRKGGRCDKRCEDFANDDITDDTVCAKLIFEAEGFKQWNGWVKKCKNKPLPSIGQCKRRRSVESQLNGLGQVDASVLHNGNEKE